MSERDRQGGQKGPEKDEADAGTERDASRGYRIPGRDFAGASYASTEREQTADHAGEGERYRLDDTQNVGGDEQIRPRDES